MGSVSVTHCNSLIIINNNDWDTVAFRLNSLLFLPGHWSTCIMMPCHVRLHCILTWYVSMEVKQQRHAYKLTQPPWLTLTQDSIWCTSTRNQEKIKRELGDISCWYLSLPDSRTGWKIATHCLLILLHTSSTVVLYQHRKRMAKSARVESLLTHM